MPTTLTSAILAIEDRALQNLDYRADKQPLISAPLYPCVIPGWSVDSNSEAVARIMRENFTLGQLGGVLLHSVVLSAVGLGLIYFDHRRSMISRKLSLANERIST